MKGQQLSVPRFTKLGQPAISFLPPLMGELPHGQQLVWKFYMILNWRESLYKKAEFRSPISTNTYDGLLSWALPLINILTRHSHQWRPNPAAKGWLLALQRTVMQVTGYNQMQKYQPTGLFPTSLSGQTSRGMPACVLPWSRVYFTDLFPRVISGKESRGAGPDII